MSTTGLPFPHGSDTPPGLPRADRPPRAPEALSRRQLVDQGGGGAGGSGAPAQADPSAAAGTVNRGAQPATPRRAAPLQRRKQQVPDPATGLASSSPSTALTTTTAPGLTQAPAAPWHGSGGGAGDRCSSPSPHGLLRPLLPGPPGARARLSRQQQSLVRAPRHGSHRPPRLAGAQAAPHAPAHCPLGGPQAAGPPHRHGLGAVSPMGQGGQRPLWRGAHSSRQIFRRLDRADEKERGHRSKPA